MHQLNWSSWRPLNGASSDPSIPHHVGGLYRIRTKDEAKLLYIGQTGSSSRGLRGRMGHLLGVFRDEMPYRAPHTAGPALWAHRQSGVELEVSVCPLDSLESDTQGRKGLEALAISLYRQEHKASPGFNFGRMPEGYEMSTSNTQRLRDSGKLKRGGVTTKSLDCHKRGVEPLASLEGEVSSAHWCGHLWSQWCQRDDLSALSTRSQGLYRIRAKNEQLLLYIGEGFILSRLKAHIKKMANPKNVQGQIFAEATQLEFSWVANQSWRAHQRLELENDLIAAHLLETGVVPKAQFLG